MTKEETAKIFMLFKTIWRDFMPEDETEAKAQLNSWTRILENHPYKSIEWAAHRCMESCVFPPRPADVIMFLGERPTRQDLDARVLLEYDPTKVVYANEAYMESKFERAMRNISEAPSMTGNHYDVGDKWDNKNKKG